MVICKTACIIQWTFCKEPDTHLGSSLMLQETRRGGEWVSVHLTVSDEEFT